MIKDSYEIKMSKFVQLSKLKKSLRKIRRYIFETLLELVKRKF